MLQATNAYTARHGAAFRIDDAPSIVTRTLKKAEIGVSEFYSDMPDGDLSSPLPDDDAFLLHLMLRDYPQCENWEEGNALSRTDVLSGTTHFYHLKRSPQFLMEKNKPFHVLGFYIPQLVFDAIADEAQASRISELDYTPGIGRNDEVVRNLGSSMLAALRRPQQASRLFVDHVTLALATHVAQAYGGLRPVERPAKGGLAPWQQRRACDLLESDLEGARALSEIAKACGLSTGHFSRAFRSSMGLAPHAWLLKRRVDIAKSLLGESGRSLSEVALAAGFADQSHFTRVFSRQVGVSPGAWRRAMYGEKRNDQE